MHYHEIIIGKLHRQLPIINVGGVSVALLNLLGDSELTEEAADALVARLPQDADMLVTPEAKAIPLAHAMSVKSGLPYVVVRKTQKPYMVGAVKKSVISITTGKPQDLVIDGADIKRLQGKKAVIIDDVVSTGGTLKGLSELLKEVGSKPIATMAVLTEGDERKDVVALGHLPLFPAEIGA
ncbi:MAG: phosphoribosyltransferase family protein [Deinococcales bacterium]